MNKIEIKIPDNLTPIQEAALIARKLAKKSLPNSTATALIGNGLTVTDLQTQIIITRVNKEKPIKMINCPICGHIYEHGKGINYFHNYGGDPLKKSVCSTECRESVLSLLGNRAAKTRFSLTAAVNYRR